MDAVITMLMVVGFSGSDLADAPPDGFFGRVDSVKAGDLRITIALPQIVDMEVVEPPNENNSEEKRRMMRSVRISRQSVAFKTNGVRVVEATGGKIRERDEFADNLEKGDVVFICIGGDSIRRCAESLRDGTMIVVVPEHAILPSEQHEANAPASTRLNTKPSLIPPPKIDRTERPRPGKSRK